MDRAAFLERVALASEPLQRVELPATFPRTLASASGDTADFETFRAALASYNGLARLVERSGLAAAVADVARELPSARTVVSPDADLWREEIEQGLSEAGAEIVRPGAGEWRKEAEQADLGITSAALAVASTGSILVVPGPDHPRVASLLPAGHLAIVSASKLVPGFEDVMPVLSAVAATSSAPVLITGPSKTSDIEMTMVFGVHGPKALRVLIVDDH
jgi:L-lactate dehydrogenase complex protein LldG